MEAGQTEAVEAGAGGETSSCCASGLIERLELGQLVQVRGGGGPRGGDGSDQGGRGGRVR